MKFIDLKMKIDLDSKIIKPTKKQITQLNQLPDKAYKFFIAQTPVKSGNARRNTRLENKDTIHADYAYAQRLEEGHSKQAPKGMIQPTENFIRKEFKKIFKK